jgi:hypothetical protein
MQKVTTGTAAEQFVFACLISACSGGAGEWNKRKILGRRIFIRHRVRACARKNSVNRATQFSKKNRTARQITGVRMDYQMKRIFGEMQKAGMIEQVPDTRTASTAYRKKAD